MITTVTRRVCRMSRNATWIDADNATALNRPNAFVQVADMVIGPAVDRETFDAHLALGNDGVAMQGDRVAYYFEHEDVIGVLTNLFVADGATTHIVMEVKVIWDRDVGHPFANPLATYRMGASL